MKNQDMPASPVNTTYNREGHEPSAGLTKLEKLAGQNMAAMLGAIDLNKLSAVEDIEKYLTTLTDAIINTSTFTAEALLSELDKRKEGEG